MAKKLVMAGLLILCISGASYADVWTLYASYPTPGPNPRGYSGDGTAGYITQDGATPYIFEVYWQTGSILSSFPAPGGSGAWGISKWISGAIYVSNNSTSWIYNVTTTGSVNSSFRCPFDGPGDMQRRFAPPYLHIAIPSRNIIALVNETTGSLVSTFLAPGSRPTACGGYSSFYVADSATNTVYEEGIPVITGVETPVGFDLLVTMDGPNEIEIFLVDDATDRIYFYGNITEVTPASLGRVKALFK